MTEPVFINIAETTIRFHTGRSFKSILPPQLISRLTSIKTIQTTACLQLRQ